MNENWVTNPAFGILYRQYRTLACVEPGEIASYLGKPTSYILGIENSDIMPPTDYDTLSKSIELFNLSPLEGRKLFDLVAEVTGTLPADIVHIIGQNPETWAKIIRGQYSTPRNQLELIVVRTPKGIGARQKIPSKR